MIISDMSIPRFDADRLRSVRHQSPQARRVVHHATGYSGTVNGHGDLHELYDQDFDHLRNSNPPHGTDHRLNLTANSAEFGENLSVALQQGRLQQQHDLSEYHGNSHR